MGQDIFLGVPLDTENYFQSLGNIPTRTSQFLQAPRFLSVIPLSQRQVLVLRVSKYSWMCLLGFYPFVLQHNTTTPLDSLTILGLVISRSSQYQHVPPPYSTTGFRACVNLHIALYNSSNVETCGRIGRRDMLVL